MARQTKLTKKNRKTKEPRIWYPVMMGIWVSDKTYSRPCGRKRKEKQDK